MNFLFHRKLDNVVIAAMFVICALAAATLPSNVLPYRELDHPRLVAFFVLEVFALIPAILALAFDQIWRIDPVLARADHAPKAFDNLRSVFLIAVLFEIILMVTRIAGFWGTPSDTAIQNQISLAVFWIGAGNFVPKLPRNFFIGAITPWTLSDEQVWHQTNRCAGWVMVAIGIAIGSGLFNTHWAQHNNLFSITLVLSLATLATYSYALWRAKQTG